jgi:L-iditol 2-dehydrogenase
VVEAVGRPAAWRAALALARPGGEVLLYGGCPAGSEVTFPTHALHYAELRVMGSYHHTPEAVRAALALLTSGTVPFSELLGPPVGLGDVPAVLAAGGQKRPVVPGAT